MDKCVMCWVSYLLKKIVKTNATMSQTQHLQWDFVCSSSLRDSFFNLIAFLSVSSSDFLSRSMSLVINALAVRACSFILDVMRIMFSAIFSCILRLYLSIESRSPWSFTVLDNNRCFTPSLPVFNLDTSVETRS